MFTDSAKVYIRSGKGRDRKQVSVYPRAINE